MGILSLACADVSILTYLYTVGHLEKDVRNYEKENEEGLLIMDLYRRACQQLAQGIHISVTLRLS